MKTCAACGISKPLDDFHRIRKGDDARVSNCRACANEKLRQRRLADPEGNRAYHLAYRRAWRANAANAARETEHARAWRTKNADRYAAHMAVAVAKQQGKLQAKPCEVCGNERADAHHDDYSRPLDVMWLCRLHHAERHKQLQGASQAA
jgi:hypothetical protein